MCISNMLPVSPYFILSINNPLKVGTIVITVSQEGRLRWARVSIIQGLPPSHTAVGHSDLSPSESLPLTSLSAFLKDLRRRVEPYEQPQDLGGALGVVRETI